MDYKLVNLFLTNITFILGQWRWVTGLFLFSTGKCGIKTIVNKIITKTVCV